MTELLNTKIADLSDMQLSTLMTELNNLYRKGTPAVADAAFDFIYIPALKKRIPQHPLLTKVQPEQLTSDGKQITHVHPMLSTKKAYLDSEIKSYTERCEQVAQSLGIENLEYRITPKLDGVAAKLDDSRQTLATRGDGAVGNDISSLLLSGLTIVGEGGGVGEIVIEQSYFEKHLSQFKHPRNFVSGVVNADNISTEGKKALADKAIHLVLFKELNSLTVSSDKIENSIVELANRVEQSCNYLCDGTVIEVAHSEVKKAMGANDHHHHWMLAFKQVGESANVKVLGIKWQVGRNKITPVIQIEPTLISGAMISNVTGHHAGNIKRNQIGKGAVLEIIRSGEIIPFSRRVISTGEVDIPEHCPCCNAQVVWSNDFITCVNSECKERKISEICYHFGLIGADLFGRKTVEKMVANGIDSLVRVYNARQYDFVNSGIGAGQAENLIAERSRVIGSPIEDFKVLASLGISSLGRGSSKRLLAVETIDNVASMNSEEIKSLENFGEITSKSIALNLKNKNGLIEFLVSKLNIKHTKTDTPKSGSLVDIKLVFTGKMASNRNDMKGLAEQNGADVQSSVRKDTTYLVTGANVGSTKINAATAKGVKVINEEEFYSLIA